MPLTLPFPFASVGLKTPAAHLDANFSACADWLVAHAPLVGLIADRPDPTLGALYVASDQNNLWYLGDGTAWHPIGRAGDGQIDLDPATGNLTLFGATVGTAGKKVLALVSATGLPTSSPIDVAQWYVTDTQGVAGRAAWHQRSEDGWITPLVRRLFWVAGNPAVTVANTVAETSLFLNTLQGGTLVPGGDNAWPRSLELYLGFDLLNNTGSSRTQTLRTKLGGVLAINVSITLGTSSGTRRKGMFVQRLTATGSAAQTTVQVMTDWDAAPTSVAISTFNPAVNMAIPQTCEVTVQHSINLATLDFRLFTAQLVLV